jgi:hypothetical protein
MTKFGIIGAALFSVVLAGPAIAASEGGYGTHHAYHGHDGGVIHGMPAHDFGMARPTYHPGRPGPYGDDNYPGIVDDDIRLPPSANGG